MPKQVANGSVNQLFVVDWKSGGLTINLNFFKLHSFIVLINIKIKVSITLKMNYCNKIVVIEISCIKSFNQSTLGIFPSSEVGLDE